MNGDVRFFDYLRDRIGLDVASVGAPMIERAVQQRRSAAGQASLEHYWQLLQGSASEQQALIEAVIVPETWFLRYPETFVALAQMARQRLAGLSGLRPLRLLSLPCSTGEEPYSIAISLLDAGLAPRQFSIDAVDISPLSVEKARRALYGRNSFRGQNLSFRERHFTTTPQGEQLHQSVMAQVRFHTGNILDPLLLAGEPPYDFVFCRNLLIYFDLPTQQRVFEVLKGFTQADGALFIGPAEGSLLARMGMRPLGIAQSFAFVRQAEPGPPPVVASAMTLRRPMASRPPIEPRPRRAPAAQPTLRPASAAQPAAAAGTAAAALAQISALANEGKSAEARQLCEDYLRQHPPQAQVYYWLGLLSDLEGDAGQAQAHYRKALYLQPQHAAALAHLAMLLAAQGDSAGARRLQERAARAADQEPG